MPLKKYLRLFLVNLAAFWLATNWLGGVTASGGIKTLLYAALVLTLVNLFVRPLLKLLLLPINLLTLGAFRWLVNVLALYLVTLLVPELKITGFLFPGFTWQGFVIPEIYLSDFWALTATSFLLSLVVTSLLWLAK